MKPFRFQSGDFNDILFEYRNKAYGAYELRKSYPSRVIKSLLLSLLFIGFLVGIPLLLEEIFRKPLSANEVFSVPVDLGKKFDVEHEKQITSVLAPKPVQQKINNLDGNYRVLKDSMLKTDLNRKDTLTGSPAAVLTGSLTTISDSSRDTSGTIQQNTGTATTSGTLASSAPYSIAAVEKVPEFPGGEIFLMDFLRKNIRYSEFAKDEKVRGRVYASFIINSKGNVEAIKIIRGLGYGLDEEVMRVLSLMPKWEPGYFRGQPVSTIFNIPVSFNLIQ